MTFSKALRICGGWLVASNALQAALGADCSNAMSKKAPLTAAKCHDICSTEGINSAEFKENCFIAEWIVNPQGVPVIQPGSECLSSWVYGYGEGENADGFQKEERFVDTASACQQQCHDTDGCAYFLFDLRKNHTTNKFPCILKTKTQINKALATKVFEDKINPAYCNSELKTACNSLYKCRDCDDAVRCLYESIHHIGGHRYCEIVDEVCEPFGPWPWTSTEYPTSSSTTGSSTTSTSAPTESSSTSSTSSTSTLPSTESTTSGSSTSGSSTSTSSSSSTTNPTESTTTTTTMNVTTTTTTTTEETGGLGVGAIVGIASAGAAGLAAIGATAAKFLGGSSAPTIQPQDLEIDVDADIQPRDLEQEITVEEHLYV